MYVWAVELRHFHSSRTQMEIIKMRRPDEKMNSQQTGGGMNSYECRAESIITSFQSVFVYISRCSACFTRKSLLWSDYLFCSLLPHSLSPPVLIHQDEYLTFTPILFLFLFLAPISPSPSFNVVRSRSCFIATSFQRTNDRDNNQDRYICSEHIFSAVDRWFVG